jgi:glycosyltransferase involved in cell wall biosynthesis
LKSTISIITAVFNRRETIEDAVHSIQSQSYKHVEHIVIDGGSNDGTLDILEATLSGNFKLISEIDDGIYDAINKGISLSSGQVIGLMHSDDFYADSEVLNDVVNLFTDSTIDIVYGDLDYVSKNNPERVVRRWVAGEFARSNFQYGWMPPHPALFVRKKVFDRIGNYNNDYKISGDYDFILRLFSAGFKSSYLARSIMKMRTGGISNLSIRSLINKSHEDYVILRNQRIGGIYTLIFKNFRKIFQFFL